MSLPNIAVLGLSHGYKFVKRIQKCNFANLVAVADIAIEEALKSYSRNESEISAKSKLNVKTYEDYKDLLKDMEGELDGVIAALPNDLHLEVTAEAGKRDINLMLEKPIAGNVSDAERITKIVEDSKIKFMVAHHRRFSKQLNRLKQEIESGTLGEIIGANVVWAAKKPDDYFETSWRVDKETGGPLLINTIHDVDDLRYIIGDIEMVQGLTNNFRGNEVEDSGVINLRFKKGAMATIFLTDNSPSPWFYEATTQEYDFFYPSNCDCYYIFGEKGSIAFPSLELFSYDEDIGKGWHRPLKRENLPVKRFDVLEKEVKHFCKLIKGKTKSKITAADATESLRVIEAIKTSSESGKTIEL